MRKRKVLSLVLAMILVFTLVVSAEISLPPMQSIGWSLDLSDTSQEWKKVILDESGVPSYRLNATESATGEELNVEKIGSSMKISAVPSALGDPWKFVYGKVTVDIDTNPVITLKASEIAGMNLQMKVTADNDINSINDFHIFADDYTISTAGTVSINLKERAAAKGFTFTGVKTFFIKIAAFPTGSSGNWSGSATISNIIFSDPTYVYIPAPLDPGTGWRLDLQDTVQEWQKVILNESGAASYKIAATESAIGEELKVEKIGSSMKISAIPTAKGDPWKFVYGKVTVDINTNPVITLKTSEIAGMNLQMKVTADNDINSINDFHVFADDYTISAAGTVSINLKERAAIKGFTFTGVKTFYIKIAAFPSGSSENWSGSATVSSLIFSDPTYVYEPEPLEPGTGWKLDLLDTNQQWQKVILNESGASSYKIAATESAIGEELKVEKVGSSMKISAIPTAKGDPWKFVYGKVTVDMDTYPIITLVASEIAGMNLQMKVTADNDINSINDFHVFADDYTISAAGTVSINLKERAAIKGFTFTGVKTFYIKIAAFPSGSSENWSGSATVSTIDFIDPTPPVEITPTPTTVIPTPTTVIPTPTTPAEATPTPAIPGVGWSLDLSDTSQEWQKLILTAEGAPSHRVAATSSETGEELTVEKIGDSMKISAVPTAKGDPWKFVYGKVTVDIDTNPIITLNTSEIAGMNLQMKVTADNDINSTNDFHVFADDYTISTAGTFSINLKERALAKGFTFAGVKTFYVKIAAFPSGSIQNWSGSATISGLDFINPSYVDPDITPTEPAEITPTPIITAEPTPVTGTTGIGWSLDLSSSAQQWQKVILTAEGLPSHKISATESETGEELTVQKIGDSMKISAVPTAKGDPWKFIYGKVTVDIDTNPIITLKTSDIAGMNLQVKVTADNDIDSLNDFHVFADDYTINSVGTMSINLKERAAVKGFTFSGVKTFYIKIAAFPSGTSENWSGSATISEITFRDPSYVQPTPTNALNGAWLADFSTANFKNWNVNTSGGGFTTLDKPESIITAFSYKNSGLKAKITGMTSADVPWQFITQKITIDIDKYPFLFINLEKIQNGDTFTIKVSKTDDNNVQGTVVELSKATDGKYDLKSILGKSGTVTFTINLAFVDSNRDGSEFVFSALGINTENFDNSQSPTTSDNGIPTTIFIIVSILALGFTLVKKINLQNRINIKHKL